MSTSSQHATRSYADVVSGKGVYNHQVMGPSNVTVTQQRGDQERQDKLNRETTCEFMKTLYHTVISKDIQAGNGKRNTVAAFLLLHAVKPAVNDVEYRKMSKEERDIYANYSKDLKRPKPRWADMADDDDDLQDNVLDEAQGSGKTALATKKKRVFAGPIAKQPKDGDNDTDTSGGDESEDDNDDGQGSGGMAKVAKEKHKPSPKGRTGGAASNSQKRKKNRPRSKKGKKGKKKRKQRFGSRKPPDTPSSESDSSSSSSEIEDDQLFEEFAPPPSEAGITAQITTLQTAVQETYRNASAEMNKDESKKRAKLRRKLVTKPNAAYKHLIGAIMQMQEYAAQKVRDAMRKVLPTRTFVRLVQGANPFCAIAILISERHGGSEEDFLLQARNDVKTLPECDPQNVMAIIDNAEINMKVYEMVLRITRQDIEPTLAKTLADAARAEAQRIVNTAVLSEIARTVPTFANTCITIRKGTNPGSPEVLRKLRNYISEMHRMTRPPQSGKTMALMTGRSMQLSQGQQNNVIQFVNNNKYLTNEMPMGCTKAISDSEAWHRVNQGRGPGQIRLTQQGQTLSEFSSALRDMQEKLVAQGVASNTAWNFAGRHIKGDKWKEKHKRKASADNDRPDKDAKRQKLINHLKKENDELRATLTLARSASSTSSGNSASSR
jgi:hypothetical protein